MTMSRPALAATLILVAAAGHGALPVAAVEPGATLTVFYRAGGSPVAGDILLCHIALPDTPTNGQNFSVDFSGSDPGIFMTLDDAP